MSKLQTGWIPCQSEKYNNHIRFSYMKNEPERHWQDKKQKMKKLVGFFLKIILPVTTSKSWTS